MTYKQQRTMQKEATYTTTNTYDTLNTLSKKTQNVWLVFHGIGYLSRFFISYFSTLSAEENYIICPQAPSKYYKDASYRRVGASWLTKENTTIDIDNVLNYTDAIIEGEQLPKDINLIVLGYSQGVSIASRWLAKRKHECQKLILISGVFPKELSNEDFTHLPNLKVSHSVGNNDPIFEKANVKKQEDRMLKIFPQLKYINHNGGHQMDINLLSEYLKF